MRTPGCIICGSNRVDKAHIKTKGSGGPNESWNIMILCRTHHIEQHKVGIITFFNKHHSVKTALTNGGWSLDESSGKPRLVHPNLAPDVEPAQNS